MHRTGHSSSFSTFVGVSLLASGLAAAPSWGQTTPPTCEATDTAITGLTPAPGDAAMLVADCTALLAGKVTLQGSGPLAGSLNWAKTESMASWDGITLSDDNSRVEKIVLSAQNPKLAGELFDLSALTALEELRMDGNILTGGIPDLSANTKLTWIDLSSNGLTGSIPDLSALTSLQNLDLDRNLLSGQFPDVTALTNLERIDARWNVLTGTLPEGLSGLTELVTLRLDGRTNRSTTNQITGAIPSLSRLTKLEELDLAELRLTGSIPSLSGLTALRTFDVGGNRLTGRIPRLTGLTNLEWFRASDNALAGPIPDLTGLASLEELYLGNGLGSRTSRGSTPIGNDLNGPIPSLDGLTALRKLDLRDAGLTGPIPDLSSLTALTNLVLSHNSLTGAFPDLSASTSLSWLDVEGNLLTGEVPDLSALSNLTVLYLSSNGFTGSLPAGLDSMTFLLFLSLCFNDFTESEMLPAAIEARRAADDLVVRGCVGFDNNVEGEEGPDLTFSVTHSSWPVREERHGLHMVYRTVDQTATALDYGAVPEGVLVIPAMGADEFSKSAVITVPVHPDTEDEHDETFLVELVNVYELTDPQGTDSSNTRWSYRWSATGTILGSGPPPQGPGPGPAPEPEPEPDPDPDPGPDPAACDRLVAPYWRGTGGIAVTPTNGRSAVFRHSCRGAQTTETLYANEAGLIVQLLSRDACTDDAGKEISTEVSVEGAEDGGWYWIDGGRNAAVAPLACEVQLGGARATVPAGVKTDVTADATLFEHHATQLLGIVPHLRTPAGGACSEYVAPYWKGTGGMVVSATDGESAVLTNTCGGVSKTQTLKANEAGLIVQLLGEDGNEGGRESDASVCTDGAGKVLRSDLSIAGIEPGGWYWLNGDRNSAVAPLACADQLGGSKATVPAGVDADATAAATLFEHHVAKLIGIVPHLRRQK